MQHADRDQSRKVTFDIVIATRNRPDALRISLPLILAQSALPERLIIVDSSDDHAATVLAVTEATRRAPMPVILERAEPNAARQRNLGLRHVTSDVAFMPDDDSLLHPGAAAAIMAVYARDTDRRIAGVSAVDCPVPPEGSLPPAAYELSSRHSDLRLYVKLRNWLEKFLPQINPVRYLAAAIAAKQPSLDLTSHPDCLRIGWIMGYLMSFRTEHVRAVGFEERFRGYSLFEDLDVSLAVQRFGCLVEARGARIYHHRHPGGRPNREAYAAMMIINRAYGLTRQAWAHGLDHAQIRTIRWQLRARLAVRLLMLAVKAGDPAARRELRLTAWAYRQVETLFRATPDTIGDTYTAIRGRLDLV